MNEPDRAGIAAGLQEIFREVFGDPDLALTDSTTAAEVEGWDSLAQIKLILACEKKFRVRLRARDINALENVGQMVDHLAAALNKSAH